MKKTRHLLGAGAARRCACQPPAKTNARSGHYLTFVFDDSEVKNEVAAVSEIYNSDYKLLQLGFTDEDLLGTAAFDDRYAREMLAYRLETRRTDAQPDGTREAPTV